jgi:hypothetical protein
MKNTPNGARVTLVSSNYGVPVVKLGLVLLQGGCVRQDFTKIRKSKIHNLLKYFDLPATYTQNLSSFLN